MAEGVDSSCFRDGDLGRGILRGTLGRRSSTGRHPLMTDAPQQQCWRVPEASARRIHPAHVSSGGFSTVSLLQLCGLGNPSDQTVFEWKSLWQAASHRYGLRGRRLLVWCRSADKSQHRSEFIPSSPTPNAQAWLALLPLGPACQRCMRGPEIGNKTNSRLLLYSVRVSAGARLMLGLKS